MAGNGAGGQATVGVVSHRWQPVGVRGERVHHPAARAGGGSAGHSVDLCPGAPLIRYPRRGAGRRGGHGADALPGALWRDCVYGPDLDSGVAGGVLRGGAGPLGLGRVDVGLGPGHKAARGVAGAVGAWVGTDAIPVARGGGKDGLARQGDAGQKHVCVGAGCQVYAGGRLPRRDRPGLGRFSYSQRGGAWILGAGGG